MKLIGIGFQGRCLGENRVLTQLSGDPDGDFLLGVSWNIAGARRHISMLQKFLHEFQPDILLLQETWCPEEIVLDDYMTFCLPAKKGTFGRAVGGLAIMVSVKRNLSVMTIGQNLQWILAVKCTSLGCSKSQEKGQ